MPGLFSGPGGEGRSGPPELVDPLWGGGVNFGVKFFMKNSASDKDPLGLTTPQPLGGGGSPNLKKKSWIDACFTPLECEMHGAKLSTYKTLPAPPREQSCDEPTQCQQVKAEGSRWVPQGCHGLGNPPTYLGPRLHEAADRADVPEAGGDQQRRGAVLSRARLLCN